MKLKFLFLLMLGSVLVSCSSVQKVSVEMTSEMLVKASPEMETEANWDVFYQSVPASLKFAEGIYSLNNEDKNLMRILSKGYGAYAYAAIETLLLESQLKNQEDEHYKNLCLAHYSKALKYGLEFLKTYDVEVGDLLERQQDSEKFVAYLNEKLDTNPETLEALFFLAQSWGGLINLQKNRPQLVTQLPVAKGIFDWVCSHDPKIQFGGCDIFYGTYEASRPAMLGGNPEKGKKIFLTAMDSFPQNLLIRVNYIQHYLIPMMDKDGHQEQKVFLDKAFTEFVEKKVRYVPGEGEASLSQDHVNLYNATAMKRFEIIKKLEKEIFE